jgi:hypothetical protein
MASGTAASVKLCATGLQHPRLLTVKIELMSASMADRVISPPRCNLVAFGGKQTSRQSRHAVRQNDDATEHSILRLQSRFIFGNKRANVIGHVQKLRPLLFV